MEPQTSLSEAAAQPWVEADRPGKSLKGRDKVCKSGHFGLGVGAGLISPASGFQSLGSPRTQGGAWPRGPRPGLPGAGDYVPFRDKRGHLKLLAQNCTNCQAIELIMLHINDFQV